MHTETTTTKTIIQPTFKDTKPCSGCGKRILWASHEHTNGLAPLVPEGLLNGQGNIICWPDSQASRGWQYRLISHLERPSLEARGHRFYVNHFTDCPARSQFSQRTKRSTKR